MIINEVRAEKMVYRFNPPLKVGLSEFDNFIHLSNYRYNIQVFNQEKDISAAVQEFGDMIEMLWKNYALESDDKLSKDAIELKQKLLSEVTVIPIE